MIDELLSQQEERYIQLRPPSSFPIPVPEIFSSLFPNEGKEIRLYSDQRSFSDFLNLWKIMKDPSPKIFSEFEFEYEIRINLSEGDGGKNGVYKNLMSYTCDSINYVFLMETTTQDLEIVSFLYAYRKREGELISVRDYLSKIRLSKPFLFEGCEIFSIEGCNPDDTLSAVSKMRNCSVTPKPEKKTLVIWYRMLGSCVMYIELDFEKDIFIGEQKSESSLEVRERMCSNKFSYLFSGLCDFEFRLRDGCICEMLSGTNLILNTYSFEKPIRSFRVGYKHPSYVLLVDQHQILFPIQTRRKTDLVRLFIELIIIWRAMEWLMEGGKEGEHFIFENIILEHTLLLYRREESSK